MKPILNDLIDGSIKILTDEMIASYLNLDIANYEIHLHQNSGRNRVFIVKGMDISSKLVKQNFYSTNEVWFYKNFGNKLSFTPKSYISDSAHNIIAVDYIDNSKSLWEYSIVEPKSAIECLCAIAPDLAYLHRQSSHVEYLPDSLGHTLELYPINAGNYLTSSIAARQFIDLLNAHKPICNILTEFACEQHLNGLIHGDIKADNILLVNNSELVMIDWELSGKGPICWDLGAIIGSMILIWANGLDLTTNLVGENWVHNSKVSLNVLIENVKRFMFWYLIESDFIHNPTVTKRQLMLGIIAWLIQRTWSEANFQKQLTKQQISRLIIAENLIKTPTFIFEELDW
jgi:thiamine kinase-like enzyme